MKTLVFTVRIEAEFYDHQQIGKNEAAHLLCQDINTVLAKYDASTGSAQIVQGPIDLKAITHKGRGCRAGALGHTGRRCRQCHAPERIRCIGGIRLSNLSPHLGLCARCINQELKA